MLRCFEGYFYFYCKKEKCSRNRGVYVAARLPPSFLSPVLQVSHPSFSDGSQPYSQLGVTNKCCLGQLLASIAAFVYKTEI